MTVGVMWCVPVEESKEAKICYQPVGAQQPAHTHNSHTRILLCNHSDNTVDTEQPASMAQPSAFGGCSPPEPPTSRRTPGAATRPQ